MNKNPKISVEICNFQSQISFCGGQGELTIHTLRKCAAQNWADHLPINVVKELMGHSSIATTQEYYSQVDSDHEAKAARVIQNLLSENKSDVQLTYEPKNKENSEVN